MFDASQYTPSFVNIATIVLPGDAVRFPCIESVLGTEHCLHECIVNVRDAVGQPHKFLIACQIGEQLPLNRTLHGLTTDAGWRGSMIVMKCGARSLFVGLRGLLERDMAFRAVER